LREFAKKYLEIINTQFKGLNLTRILDPEEFYYKQVLDSVKPLEESQIFSKALETSKLLVDIGFGGGFPLLPLAFKFPQYKFIGIDSTNKKVKAVGEISKMFHMEHVKVYHQRFEEILFDKEAVLTFKAVGKISEILPELSYTAPITVFFYKGPQLDQKENFESILNEWDLIEEKIIEIPNTDGRLILGFKPKKLSKVRQKNLVNLKQML
jgi:16S rRNA (guanine527-N7)-methyltransferase